MAKVNVKVEFNYKNVEKRIEQATKKGQLLMAEQALKDSNYFVKKDSGELEASSIKSELDKGLLIWDTPYAKKQYYTGTPSKDVNPNASKLWAHRAYAQFGNEWAAILQKVIDKEV